MKISKVQGMLLAEDILSIINEFLDVDGLDIKDVSIDNKDIMVLGSMKKGAVFNFAATIAVEGVKEGKIYCRFSKLKIMNLGIFRLIRSLALKKTLKYLKVQGLDCNKETMIIDINKLLIDVPYVNLDVSNVFVKDNMLHVEVEEVIISIRGQLIKEKEKEKEKECEEKVLDEPLNKVSDAYTVGRQVVEGKLPEAAKSASDIIFMIPDIGALLWRLLKDSRVPMKTKLSVSAAVAYILFPVDIIPDKIPFIGKIDDIAILFFALNRIAKDVPTKVILENWQGKSEFVLVLKKGLEYLVDFTGAGNVEKLYNIVEELSTL